MKNLGFFIIKSRMLKLDKHADMQTQEKCHYLKTIYPCNSFLSIEFILNGGHNANKIWEIHGSPTYPLVSLKFPNKWFKPGRIIQVAICTLETSFLKN